MVLLLVVGYVAYRVIDIGQGRFENVEAARAKERAKILEERRAEDKKWLHDKASWFNKEKGLVRVPIEEAKRLTVAELARIQPHPGVSLTEAPPQPPILPKTPDQAGKTTPQAPSAPAALPTAVTAPAANPTPAAATAPTPATQLLFKP
jgi:hypothetical protein